MATGVSVLLVERNNIEAGTRFYTLRTVHQQFIRMASFLFADVLTPDDAPATVLTVSSPLYSRVATAV